MQRLSFKIRPSPRARLYFVVRVFDGCREMRSFQRNQKPRRRTPTSGKWLGLSTRWGWTERDGVRSYDFGDEVGEILLWRKHLGSSVVTHEVAHAMFALCHRWRLKLPEDGLGWPEERACYALGNMTRQIYDRLYDEGYC